MENRPFTREDGELMILALDALLRLNPSDYSKARIIELKRRIASASSTFTAGEIRNICIGLETILSDNPMDWKAEQLLSRLRSVLDRGAPQI